MISTATLLFRFGIVVLIVVLLDFYLFQGLKTLTYRLQDARIRTWIHSGFWSVNVLLILLFPTALFMYRSGWIVGPQVFKILSVFILFLLPKLVFIAILLGEDVV